MSADFDLICLSHLRWDFVYQRPQHLMSRFARERRVFFVEEVVYQDGPPSIEVRETPSGVRVCVPHFPEGLSLDEMDAVQRDLLNDLLDREEVRHYALWFYTPMATEICRGYTPVAVVYDCMDELSAFRGAPPELRKRERDLFDSADLVFTGGRSLYEAKRLQHPFVHCFPSSVDVRHFRSARGRLPEPIDQARIPRPRIGYCGVIDERMDFDLLAGVMAARPDWHLVMVGPVPGKIDPDSLPRGENIHYLGTKPYGDLPSYLAGWDVALLPFARNEATRFISPTKTPEYLAAGRPVVSTSIRDVVDPYGTRGLVGIADTIDDFVEAVDWALQEDHAERRATVDDFLNRMSWDRTWGAMSALVENVADGEGEQATTQAETAEREGWDLTEVAGV